MGNLTEHEIKAMQITVELANTVAVNIIGSGTTRQEDIREFVYHLHAIQNMILSQSAGRAYPNKYRLLGESL